MDVFLNAIIENVELMAVVAYAEVENVNLALGVFMENAFKATKAAVTILVIFMKIVRIAHKTVLALQAPSVI